MNRRHALQLTATVPFALAGIAQPAKKKVAAVVTEYRHWSHADVVCGRLLGGNSCNGVWSPPRTRLVSLYRAQVPANDMSLDLAARHGFKIYPTIKETLLFGKAELGVDAVAFIGEHGDYPRNPEGQKLYPRFELFNEVLDVIQASGRPVPVFFDKHFSTEWTKAERMFRRVRELKIPFIAGSSIPVDRRLNNVQPALDCPMSAAAAIGYGPLDDYGFHLLEGLQVMVERRKGGETGVQEVELVEGPRIWEWLGASQGSWANPLLQSAWALDPNSKQGSMERQAKSPALFRVVYKDGFKAVALLLTPSGNDRTVAMEIAGRKEPLATLIGPPGAGRPLPHFDGLVKCIEDVFVGGKEIYPPERTLLTTGILAFAFDSKRAKAPVMAPLNVSYRAPRNCFFETA